MKARLSHVKNILFDLGNVILNLDFDATIRAFQQLGLDRNVLDRQQAYADPVFYQLEVGKVTPEEFRNRVRVLLNNSSATDQQIDDAWYAMIRDIPAKRVKALQELRKQYKVFLFSNTNVIHMEWLHKTFSAEYGFEFSSLFDKDYYSYGINERKPDLISFEKVIALSAVNPSETLFVDDLEKNITAAKLAGLQTLWLQEGMEMAELF
jgi:HAD superfamily hydrolase (TIGR01509 family)